MNKKSLLSLCLTVLGMGVLAEPLVYYVDSVKGSDEYPGAAGAPFKTLERALKQWRVHVDAGGIPEGGMQVEVAAGRYEMPKGVVMEPRDSGTAGKPLVWKGAQGAVLSGSTVLPRSAFSVVTDEAVLKRLPEAARGKVLVVDIAALGLPPCKKMADVFRGLPGWGELVIDGKVQEAAHWPNEGWAVMGEVLDRGAKPAKGQDGHGGRFRYLAGTPAAHWPVERGVWLYGYWCHDWHEEYICVEAVDTTAKTIALKSSKSVYGVGASQKWNKVPRRYRVMNVLEELDCEGEWCLEAGSTLLYAWLPPAKKGGQRIELTRLEQPFFTLNCSQVEVRGFRFENARGGGVDVKGDGNRISGCEFVNLGGNGVNVSGHRNVVTACDLHELGRSGVYVRGGNEMTLERGDNVVENCHIYGVGRHQRTYCGAVHLTGVGNTARHNLMHDLPHTAIFYDGNEHLIELNEIFSTCLETGDAGALYTGRTWASQGNVVRHNYIHHNGGVNGWSMGVYLDDCDSGDTVEGNVFVDVRRAVFIGGGRDNHVLNNVFIDCSPALHLDDRGLTRIRWNAGPKESWDLQAKLEARKYKQPPWSIRYPHLVTIMDDQPALPLHNVVENNVVVGGSGFSMKEGLRKLLVEKDNWFTVAGEPMGIADRANGRLLPPMEVVRQHVPEFMAIPFQNIGLQKDGVRTTLPSPRVLLQASQAARAVPVPVQQLPKVVSPVTAAPAGKKAATSATAVSAGKKVVSEEEAAAAEK